MGIYENTFWAHLTFDTHSVLWPVTSWNLHCTMYSNYGLLMYTGPMMYFDTRISIRPFWWVVDFDAAIWSWKPNSRHRRNVSLSGKSGQTTAGTRVEWEHKSSISWTYLCSGDFKRQAFSPFWCMSSQLFSTNCCLGKPNNAARDVIWTAHGNSLIIGGNASARATAKPSTIKWFHLVPPEYYLTTTERENSADQNTFFDILMIIII